MNDSTCTTISTYLSPYTYIIPADVIYRTCELALTLPEAILNTPFFNERTLASLPLARASNLSSWICIVKRFKDWTSGESWDRATLCSMICLTLGNIADQAYKLDTAHHIINLGKALNPLSAVSSALFVGYCIADFFASRNSIEHNQIVMSRAITSRMRLIEGRDFINPNERNDPYTHGLDYVRWGTFVNSRIDKWHQRYINTQNPQEQQKFYRKTVEWQQIGLRYTLGHSTPYEEYKGRIEKRNIQEHNADLEISKSWWSIAYDVSLTALIALELLLLIPSLTGIISVTLIAAAPLFNFMTALLDWGTNIYDAACPTNPDLPVRPILEIAPANQL